MEKTTNFPIDPIFKDPSLLKELVDSVAVPENNRLTLNKWFIFIIDSDPSNQEIARVYSNDLMIKTVHQFISHRVKFDERLKILDTKNKTRKERKTRL